MCDWFQFNTAAGIGRVAIKSGVGIGTDGGYLTKRECRHPRLSRKGGDIDTSICVVPGKCCDAELVHRLGYRGRGRDGESLSSRSTLLGGFFLENV